MCTNFAAHIQKLASANHNVYRSVAVANMKICKIYFANILVVRFQICIIFSRNTCCKFATANNNNIYKYCFWQIFVTNMCTNFAANIQKVVSANHNVYRSVAVANMKIC